MKLLDHEYFKNFDFIMLFTVIFISVLGILNLYGSLSLDHRSFSDPFVVKQVIWLLISYFIMFIIISIDYNTIIEIAYYIYAVVFVLLLVILIKGRITHGAERWFSFGIVTFQPSELVKITLILALAKFFTAFDKKNGYRIRDLIVPFFLILVPAFLIAKEPDLGTALIVFFLGFIIIYLAGMKRNSIIIAALTVLVFMPFIWMHLKAYQKERLLVFLRPSKDYLGAGYNIIQSKIAVGAGGLIGNGFGNGSQSLLNFLPAKHTDFIFSTFAQQFGFLGSLLLISLYFVLVIRGFQIVSKTKKLQGFLVGAGALSILILHTIINICMAIGILPVVGVPLPFFSYGGTSLLVDSSAVALLLNISMRRYKFQSA